MTIGPDLTSHEAAMLKGEAGPVLQFAMELVVTAARQMAAPCLIPAGFAHIDACFYAGQAHIDFARYLLDNGARFDIPAWTNNGLVSLSEPELREESAYGETVRGARELMHLYEQLGCRPVWTCAPYQLPGGPQFGDHIIVAESNAVSYYNSVVGARTNKNGDFLDVAYALTARVPLAGLHVDEGRRGEVLFNVCQIPQDFRSEPVFYHLLGHHVGRIAGRRVPVINGLPPTAGKDDLKAISAAVASAGGVALWHGIGVTPEAADLETAFQGQKPKQVFAVTMADLSLALAQLSPLNEGELNMVSLGTPHFSFTELGDLVEALDGRKIHPDVTFYVSTGRFVKQLAAEKGWIDELERAGVTIITDTCTYMAPAVRHCHGRVMTNSAKWAYYAPGMLNVEVAFGSLLECVNSAIAGKISRDPRLAALRAA